MPADAFVQLRHEQRGVVTRSQLYAVGCGDNTVRAQLAARRWRLLNDRVVCLHNGPLTRKQQLWAVHLSAQAPSAMCGLTGVQLWGISGFDTEDVHIVVRRGARVMPVPGVNVVVHESRRFSAEDVLAVREPAVLWMPRCVVDAAVWTRDVKTACRILIAPVQQRRDTPQSLRAELVKAGQVRHRRVLSRLLDDLEAGAQALSEVEFLKFCRRHQFPRPELQHRLDSAGRRRYLDATFRRRDGTFFRVEVDGGIHLDLMKRWRDTSKDNDASLDGHLVLRYPSVAIYTDDPHAVAQIRRALQLVSSSRGYNHGSC